MKTFASLLYLSILALCVDFRAAAVPPSYNLNSIPDQTVWSGSSRSFIIRAAGGPMVVNASPVPAGDLTLESLGTNGDWLFTYQPAPSDILPFDVTISVAPLAFTTFTITPQPILPPETSVFGTDQHTLPVVSKGEPQSFERNSLLAQALNYETAIVKYVRFVGDAIVLEAGHTNGLYDAYCDGRRDIASLEIFAETVTIRDPLRMKQTDVTIWARELIFEDDGQISTTPEERLSPAGVDANGGLPGVDGLPAGNLTLKVGSLVNRSSSTPLLDARGGRGQPGGPGAHGADGASVSTYWSSYRVCDTGLCKTHTAPAGYYITYWYYTFAGITVSEGGTKTRPGNGTSAKASGKPGEGGAGGTISSTVEVSGLFANNGGASAAPSVPTSWPYEYYKGGEAGFPQNSQHVHFYLGFFEMLSSAANHTATRGQDAPIRTATTIAGPDGSNLPLNAAWLHPLAVRKVLDHVKDAYLANDIEYARVRLADYNQLLTSYRFSADWPNVALAEQLELAQLHDEIRILLHRLDGGLDYFGNPAGWVPMLSFEVTKNIFESEIDHAIQSLYLAYWIGNKASDQQQQVNALSAARDQLRAELTKAQSDYDSAIQRLPSIESKALRLQTQIQNTQNKLEAEEIKLLNDTREPDWVLGLRFGLKISAMMCQMIPVYQPALGAVGQGIRLASDIDPEHPWEAITGAPSIVAAYTNSPFATSAVAQQQAKNQIDPKQAEAKAFDYLGALQQAGTGLSTGISDIQGFIESRKAPSAEMLAELERLKSRSPEYKALLEEVEQLMLQNKEFTEELLATMQQIFTLSDTITHSLLAIDALNRQLAPGLLLLDERVNAYLSALERRAFDRLLKYHYYMAKASEYRLLKPYPHALDLEGLFIKFREIADLNATTTNAHTISPDQFETLRAVYQGVISDLAESIYEEYLANAPEQTVAVRFSLTQEELDALNAGQHIILNPYDLGFFPLSHENIRIVDFKVFTITTEPQGGGSYGTTAELDLYMEHSGLSTLKRNGQFYSFRHYNRLTQNPLFWGARYFPTDGDIFPIKPSAAADSLLRSLLSSSASSDMLLYSRPSAWADIILSREYQDNTGRKILIKSARLEMQYDFMRRNDSLNQRTIEVLAGSVQEGLQAQSVSSFALDLRPFFVLDKSDINDRRNARGRFTRVYNTSVGNVTVEAPLHHGQWQFHRWTDRFGLDLPGGPFTNSSLTLNLQADTAVMAQYIPIDQQVIFEAPILSGGNISLRWNGAPDLKLQTATNLNGYWLDVPSTLGQSQFSLPATGQAAFFRIVRNSAQLGARRWTPPTERNFEWVH
jgi:hypothetical protein